MLNIDVHYESAREQFIGVMRGLKDRLLQRGYRLRFYPDTAVDVRWPAGKPDGVITHQAFVVPELEHADVPVILAERLDCSILWSRKVASWDCVKAVWKIAKSDFANQNIGAMRVHVFMLGGCVADELEPIGREVFDKIQVMPGYLPYPAMSRWLHKLFMDAPGNGTPGSKSPGSKSHRRQYDIVFRGKLDYRYDAIGEHRRSCYKAVEKSQHTRLVGRKTNRHVHDLELLDSLCCVSPWGYGELCWRDFEAAAAGCVLIKPFTPVETFPAIFAPEDTYRVCSPHWSDLDDVIDQVKADPARHAAMVEEARIRCRAVLDEDAVIERFMPGLRALR